MNMASYKSVSDEWREKGNNSYQKVTDGLYPALRVSRLQDAISCYSRALSTATSNTERSSACKNVALAHWKLARSQAASGEQGPIVSFNYKKALSYFQDAKDFGECRDAAWHGGLNDAAVRCWFDVSERLETLETKDRVRELNQTVGYILDDKTKAREYYELAMCYFHLSVTALGDRDHKKTLTLLKDCYFPLKEAERFGHSDPGLVRECAVLEDDIFLQTSVAESIQERMRGEEMLVHVMRDEETLNIDMVWDVVDSFRLAAQLTKERDLEMEAVALSNLGHVFHVVLQLKDRAKACLKKVLELANSMVPRNFTGEGWYEFARSTVEYYQQQTVRAEVEGERKEREEVLMTLKEEMAALMKAHWDKVAFLKFVYATHPPKNPGHKLKEMTDDSDEKELKKLYQRAVIHYHPDKVDADEHGKPWKVLTEEITKLLTAHYEGMKGV